MLNRIIHLLCQSSLILDMARMDTPKQWEQLRTPYLYTIHIKAAGKIAREGQITEHGGVLK